jgi:hypothetical protein
MRRLLTATALTLVIAAAFAATAAAKEMSVALAAGPPTLDAGEPWSAELLIHGEPDILREATPGITIDNGSGEQRTFTAKPTGKRAPDGQLIYRVRVAFPAEGRWTYELIDGVSDRAYEGGQLTVGSPASEAAPSAPSRPETAAARADDDSSLPSWPFIVAGVAFVLAAGILLTVRRRFQPSA